MEEVFKQIAIIKEEYACTAKELQYEAKSTTDLRESTSRYEEMTREMAERSEFNETEMYVAKMELYDAIARKRMLEMQVEDKKSEAAAILKELEIETTKHIELVESVRSLTSPDDYKQNVQDQQAQVQTLKKQIQQETATRDALTSKLQTLESAARNMAALKPDLERLRATKATILKDLATLEKRNGASTATKPNEQRLQQDLKEAKERYHYLCAHLEIIE
jgi:chromosome segregation ATPase